MGGAFLPIPLMILFVAECGRPRQVEVSVVRLYFIDTKYVIAACVITNIWKQMTS